MALFCAAIRKDSVSLSRFPFLCYVQIISYEMSLVCRLKYPYSCLSFDFCFLVIFVLGNLVSCVLFLVAIISLTLRFFLLSSLVHFMNGPEYLTKRSAQVFIHLMRFLLFSLVSSNFLVLLRFSFLIVFLISACLMVTA